MKRGLLATALLTGATLASSAAEARAIQDERYNYELIWNAAVRLLHVDMGFAITERDREAGFLLFTYREGTRSTPGSLELVRAQVDGVSGTRIIVQLPQEPSYAERLILNRLSRKLREEYGEPPPPAPAPRPREPQQPDDRPAAPGNDRPSSRPEDRPATPPRRPAPAEGQPAERPRNDE